MSDFTAFRLSATASVIALIAAGSPAFAEPAPAGASAEPTPANCVNIPAGAEHDQCVAQARVAQGESPSGKEAIVVTGTRINRPTLTSSVPVTSVSPLDLANQGNVSLGDKLAELPQIRATFTQANSTRFIGTSGINALDLRGLGTQRTLVLQNGRRIVTATPGVNRPDVNVIPIDLVERIDIVTGGNSAIYGSDAVAGVVNFVMRRDFEGIRLSGQVGTSSRKDRTSRFIGLVVGHNFFDDRANVAVAAEWTKQSTLWNTDRDNQTGAFSGRHQFQLSDYAGIICNPTVIAQLGVTPTPGICPGGAAGIPAETAAGDGIPDTTFLTGIRNNTISEGGLFTAACPVAPAPDPDGPGPLQAETVAAFNARRAAACSGLADPNSTNALAQLGRTFVFQGDGTLIANPCIQDFRPFGSGNCQGGLGSTLRLSGMLAPGIERKAINLLAHYTISDAFEPFVEAKYVRVDANQEGQPTFFNNTFRVDNPFLSPQARAQIQAVLTPAQRANPNQTFTAQRFNIDFGGRGELHKRENYQLVGGVRGTFNDDWKYEISGNYGKLYTYYETKGNILRSHYTNALDARVNGSGQIVCGINADAVTTNDDPACVPINLFGFGAPSPEALNYVLYTSFRKQRAKLYDATGYVAGDLSQLFELWGGPIAFVVGAEYRKETAFAAYDPITSSTACGTTGCTFLNVIPDFRPPDLKVSELFGEISIPILKDMPFAQELTIDGAGRYSHYNIGNTGGVFAWNVNGTWAPIRDIRFRGGLARSVRAPTQSDLFSPATQTFLNGLVDPCSQTNINQGPQVNGVSVRIANCAAAGVPTTQTFGPPGGPTTTLPFTNVPASGVSANNQGNEALREERGTSLTLGGIIQPRIFPGFSLTVDYYRIRVKNVIQALTGQTIINQCYDSLSGINNPFCAVVFRNPNGTFAGQSNVIHGGTTFSFTPTGPAALITSFNFAKLETAGIDFDAAYRHRIMNKVTLNLRGILTHTFYKNLFSDILDPTFKDRILGELGDPAWQGQLSTTVDIGKVSLGHRVRYIGKQTVALTYETQHEFQGRPPTNADAFPRVWYPELWSHDFRVDVKVTPRHRLYAGVDNAFDRLPPFDLLGVEAGSISPVGRFFYVGAVLDLK
jgi:outer membrane receptor protein involved in Fe transport